MTIVSVANAVSTIVGVPITWFLLLFTPIRRTAWLAPFEEEYEGEHEWLGPISALVLLVPFFFASWFIEYLIAIRMVPSLETGTVNAAVLAGNLVTYACLAVFILSVSIRAIQRDRRSRTEMHGANAEASEHAYEGRRAPLLEPSTLLDGETELEGSSLVQLARHLDPPAMLLDHGPNVGKADL